MSQQPPANPAYSTLEVSGQDPETYQKEVVYYPDHSIPQAVPVEQTAAGAAQSYYSPESAKEVVGGPANAYAPGVLPVPYKSADGANYQNTAAYGAAGYPAGVAYSDASGYPNSAYPNSAYPQSVGSPIDGNAYGATPLSAGGSGSQPPLTDEKAAPAAAAGGRVCGLSKKMFFILVGVAIVVIALVAGLAAGLASKHSDGSKATDSQGVGSGNSSSSNSTTNEKLILANSKITASNWTDSDGVVHRTVFFQDIYDSLIARRWDSDSNAWKTNNLTELRAATTTPLRPQSGTPLASASMDHDPNYETHLWFLDGGNIIRSMASFDALNKPDSWDNDTLDGAVLETWPGSGLAGMWQRTWGADGDGSWIVAYQRPSDGSIKTANSSIWGTSTVAIDFGDVAANSSLAIIPQLRGAFLDRLELVSEKVNGDTTGTMQVTTFNDTWNDSNDRQTTLQSSIPLPASKQQFAVTKWDSWTQALYLALLDGGELEGSYFDGSTRKSLTSFSFNDGPDTNFTAIAMSPNAMFYGISNNEILEYSVDTSNPSNFNYVGRVFP
ncbi:hypothetical protein M426DRAFT_28118 [Hypoxylon sp. CI-4A]|nr:hypothetical protein M426DRAFT_28118 [Hypoxylon sp. CI-4A]